MLRTGIASLTAFPQVGALLAADACQVPSPARILELPPRGLGIPPGGSRQHACFSEHAGLVHCLPTGATCDACRQTALQAPSPQSQMCPGQTTPSNPWGRRGYRTAARWGGLPVANASLACAAGRWGFRFLCSRWHAATSSLLAGAGLQWPRRLRHV